MVVGVDPSLTSTAIADELGIALVKSKARGMERLHEISQAVVDAAGPYRELVVIESYTYATTHSAHYMGELGGVIRYRLWKANIPFVDVPPAVLKKFATGRGNASKAEVLSAAVRRSGRSFASDDESDAWWLYALGCELLGDPVVKLPEQQRAAILALAEQVAHQLPIPKAEEPARPIEDVMLP